MEKFDVVKAISSPFTGLFWWKVLMFGLGLCFMGMVGWSIWKTYNPDPTTNQYNRAAVIVNHNPQPQGRFGCAHVQINEYFKDRAGNSEKGYPITAYKRGDRR